MYRSSSSQRIRWLRDRDSTSDGWAGIKDRELLVLAAAEFDIFVTADRNLSFQHNLSQLDLSLIVLQAQSNRLADLKPLVPKVLEMLDIAPRGQATLVGI